MRSIPGVLLIQLGTPDAPTVPALRRYLRQFLSDPQRFALLQNQLQKEENSKAEVVGYGNHRLN
jgi:protoheme ferro-lyase